MSKSIYKPFKVDPQTSLLNNTFLRDLWTSPRYRLFRHLLALLAISVMVFNMPMLRVEPFATYGKLSMFCLWMFLFYTNMYWLVPRFLFRNKYPQFGLGIIAYIGLTYMLITGTQNYLRPYLDNEQKIQADAPKMLPITFLIAVLVAASAAIKLFQRWVRDSERINELEKATIQAELEQLKNQINPHFLFNMLNNANLLTQKDPVKASQVLMKLSDLLRYQLYDSTRPKVLLTADIQFLTDFLNLEKIRRDNFDFKIYQEGEVSGVLVAPLMFITFVENAIKHNMDAERLSFVDLNFKVKTGELYFKCINSKPPMKEKSNPGGLGLTNLKRRLELLYPQQHELYIIDETHLFCVTLMIKL